MQRSMKNSDDEEYGGFYSTSRTSASGSNSGLPPPSSSARYRYGDYSPSRSHHSTTNSSTNTSSSLGAESPYQIPQNRAYTRTPPYTSSGRSMVEYAPPPPCCHQFYHPPPPIPLHPSQSPSHFNTIPHPPIQYRDVPACATLNRSCYSRRSSASNPYSSYYPNSVSNESPYGDIYYTSTLTRHSRHSGGGSSSGGSSSSHHRYVDNDGGKIYDTPTPPPAGFMSHHHPPPPPHHHQQQQQHPSMSSSSGAAAVAASLRAYGISSSGNGANVSVNNSGGNGMNSSSGIGGSSLRLDEPNRIYSSSSLQLGSNNPSSVGSLQRSSSPQHHYIDRSISLIRLDTNTAVAAVAAAAAAAAANSANNSTTSTIVIGSSNASDHSSGGGSVTLATGGGSQPRFVIKFSPDVPSQSQQQQSIGGTANLIKTSIELGSSNDPLSMTPNKAKFKVDSMTSSITITSSNAGASSVGVNNSSCNTNKPVVEMSDKAVMTTQLPEQWSCSTGSGDGRRISLGGTATSPPGHSPPPASTLSGGVPDLLPTCVVRGHNEYASTSCRISPGSHDLPDEILPLRRITIISSSGDSDNEDNNIDFDDEISNRRNSGNMMPSPNRRSYHSGGAGNSSSGSGPSCQMPGSSRGGCGDGDRSGNNRGGGNKSGNQSHHNSGGNNYNDIYNNGENNQDTKWTMFRSFVKAETRTFFGLEERDDLKEEWLSRRKRFACRRYSERNVDSMPPPSPYQPPPGVGPLHGHHAHAGIIGHDQIDRGMDQRGAGRGGSRSSRRTRKKDHVFVIYWNLLRWIFWALRFGRTGQRVAAGAGCGSDTNPGSIGGSTTPGRVPLDSQMSRDRTKSRSLSPATLADVPPNVTCSPQELFFDDLEDNHRNSTHHLQPPGRGLHWRIARNHHPNNGYSVSNRISAPFLNKVLDNSERQQYRQGLRQPTSTFTKLALIDEYEDFRPYFTYWISIVQVIILIVTMITYGPAPFGLDLHRKSSLVLVTSLSLQQMEVIQPANFWIGPSASDLIHLGAKYAPCMRRDEVIHRRIVETRDRERQTACCIRNDNSGCVQSSRNECSGLLSTWKKWTKEEGPGGRISGSVCGLDPKYCEAPASIAPFEWPDDITKWPICRKTRGLSGMSMKDKTAEHMVCEVIGHPCCIGIHAKCLITTREYCRFVNGYFHEEASLCSQVSCLSDVCGMFPFLAYEQPDQFYRLISSMFLHAGLGHIFITLLFHWFILRDLEKLAGPLRIAVIYFGAGIAGNLASVLLEPHRAEVGPGGGQYGVMACLLVELLHMWGMLRRPWQALGKMVLVMGILFLIGFLPWVDNFAHISGFLVGFVLSHAIMTYVAFVKYSTYRKWLEVVICLSVFFSIVIALLVVFYAGFGESCEHCGLLVRALNSHVTPREGYAAIVRKSETFCCE